MQLLCNADTVWYHGSNIYFSILNPGSTITPWKALAEAFSHKPSQLEYDDDGNIQHNGTQKGYLYKINGPILLEKDIYPHPRSTMTQNAEFLTTRPLQVKLLKKTVDI